MATGNMIDLAGMVEQANKDSDAFANVATDAAAQTSSIATQKADLYTGVASAQAAVETSKATAELALEKRNNDAASLFGTNPDVSSYIIGQLKDKSDAAFAERESALADVQQKQSINLLDNPLGFILAQATVNSDIERHNTANAKVQMYDDRIKELNDLTQTQARTNIATAISSNAADIANKATVASAAANAASLDASAQALHWNVQFLGEAYKASRDQLTSAFQLHSAQDSEAQLAIAQQNLNLHKEEFQFRKDEKTKNEQEDGFLISHIRDGYARATGKQFTGSPAEALMLYKKNDPMVTSWYAAGKMSEAAGMTILATNPLDALTLQENKVIIPNAGTSQVLNKLGDYYGAFQKTPEAQAAAQQAKDTKQRGIYEQAFTKFANAQLQSEGANADASSILKIPSMDTYVPKNPTLAASPLWNNVLKDSAIDKSDANALFSTTVAAVKNGKISYNDALDLQRFFAAGVLTNAGTKNFAGLGVVQPKSYNARIQSAYSGTSSVVNLADPTSFAAAFNKAQAAGVLERFGSRGDTGIGE